MGHQTIRRIGLFAGGFLGAWLFFRYLFPLFLPFFLGFLLALAAEPAVKVSTRLLKLPRWAASGLGVSFTLVFLVALVGILGAALVKELTALANRLPDMEVTLAETSQRLRTLLENAADNAPEGIRPLAEQSVNRLFSASLLDQAAGRLPGKLTAFLSRVPDGALGIGTGIISGFMLSARLPDLKAALRKKFPRLQTHILPALNRAKSALLGWLKAQAKLSAITYAIVAVGLMILQVPYGPLWAIGVAIVDAFPILGTGTILIPWSVVYLFQQKPLQSVGLLCIYAAAVLTRTTLEPRLVGRHLGLDPLITLVMLYLGYRFWGILGMLLAPMLTAAIVAAGRASQENK